MNEPTWWLYGFPDEKQTTQLNQILGEGNFVFGHKQPYGNIHATFWPYLDVVITLADNKKLLVEMLLGDLVVRDQINAY
jgi:hypothetical protein